MDEALLPAIQKCYDMNRWLVQVVERFPRRCKFTLGDRLQLTGLDLQLALIEAAHARNRDRALHRASRLLDQLRLLLRLSFDTKVLRLNQYEFASTHGAELGRMIGGWIRWERAAGRGPGGAESA